MSESFFYSNMSPQAPSFNRGIWKKLEDKARDFAVSNSNIYIVTGPILTAGLPTIGHNQVSIPEYYYKVILDYTKPDIKAIAFLMANEGSSESLESFVVSVDSIEVLTGIDFFPKLPDDDEVALEKQSDANVWDLTALKTAKKKTEVQESSSGQAVQCKGLTKKGTRCKRMTTDPSGYCWQHKKIYKK